MADIEIARSAAELRATLSSWRHAGQRIALVPTMGALHAGHLSLVHRAGARGCRVVVSIFVNPTQFAAGEDFAAYPRTEDSDIRQLAGSACALVFAPSVAEMYPEGHATTVTVAGPALGLESDFRPSHFAGVATVVTKLLLQCMPDVALFGEKDYQQLLVIRQFARDLGLSVEIEGVPTLREADGLAMSSRNIYLSAQERAVAPALFRALSSLAEKISGGSPITEAEETARHSVLAAGFDSVDYLTLRDAETLAPLVALEGRPARVLAAARLGRTRLIDNVAV